MWIIFHQAGEKNGKKKKMETNILIISPNVQNYNPPCFFEKTLAWVSQKFPSLSSINALLHPFDKRHVQKHLSLFVMQIPLRLGDSHQ